MSAAHSYDHQHEAAVESSASLASLVCFKTESCIKAAVSSYRVCDALAFVPAPLACHDGMLTETIQCVCVVTVCIGLVGLAISYALSVTGLLSGAVTSFTETEKQMVSVERAMQYIRGVPAEKDSGTTMVSRSVCVVKFHRWDKERGEETAEIGRIGTK